MATTKSDSKSNLNESTLPLLDDDKEKIELKAKTESGAQDAATAVDNTATDAEKAEKEKAAEEAKRKKEEEKENKRKLKQEEEEKKKQAKLEKQKKKDEEKELKKQKKEEKKAAAEAAKANGATNTGGQTSCFVGGGDIHPHCSLNNFTAGINFLERDERSVNQHVNVNFEDLIGEPDSTQGFDGAYRYSFGIFQCVRFWVYRLLMGAVSLPLALLWGVVFALLSVFSVWLLTPAFRVVEVGFYFFHRLWNVTVRTILDPVFSSIALVRSSAHPFHRTPVATYSGRVLPSACPHEYHLVPNQNVCVSYKKSESDDDVTDKQITLNLENL